MPRILVIDDQPDCSEPLAKLLKLCGYETVVAHHGVDALTLLDQARPELVILDLMMPVMDGFDFLKAMRSDRRWPDVPVIVFSAYCDERMKQRLKKLGVSEVFGKGRGIL